MSKIGRSLCRAVLAATIALTSHGALAQGDDAPSEGTGEPTAEEVARCQGIIDSLAARMDVLEEGGDSRVSSVGSILRNSAIIGQRCSDEQLIDFITSAGYRHVELRELRPGEMLWGPPTHESDRILTFVAYSTSFWRRLLSDRPERSLAVEQRNRTVVHISFAGNK